MSPSIHPYSFINKTCQKQGCVWASE